jgi:uncharacterized membrane protein HdeD (DUF308 family)
MLVFLLRRKFNMSTFVYNPRNPLTAGLEEIRRSWGWFLFLGIALTVLGVAAVVYDVAATFTTVLFFGWLLLISGIVQLVQAFRVGTWNGFFLYLLGALFRGFAGFLLIRYPVAGAQSLTLALGFFFIVGGLFRAIASGTVKFPRWGWAVFSGVISVILGVMLLSRIGTTSLWFIGFALGVDLIFDGLAVFNFASAVHHLPAIEAR